jgi:hypothetical protein
VRFRIPCLRQARSMRTRSADSMRSGKTFMSAHSAARLGPLTGPIGTRPLPASRIFQSNQPRPDGVALGRPPPRGPIAGEAPFGGADSRSQSCSFAIGLSIVPLTGIWQCLAPCMHSLDVCWVWGCSNRLQHARAPLGYGGSNDLEGHATRGARLAHTERGLLRTGGGRTDQAQARCSPTCGKRSAPDRQPSDDLRNVQGEPGFVDCPQTSCLDLKAKTERAGKSSEANYRAKRCRMS